MDAELTPPGGRAASEWITLHRFAVLLGLLLFAAYPQVLLGTAAFYYRDYGVLGYPFVYYHRLSVWSGELPFWNPLSNCGAPFLAQWGTMTLYPLSVIYLLLPLPWSLGFFCLLHLFLGGLGMFVLARNWTKSPFAAAVAGVAFVFNGATLSCLLWPNYAVALGWMPWVVWSMERAWRAGGPALAGAALLAALQMLSGVPELIGLTWLFLGALWMLELFSGRVRRFDLLRRSVLVVVLTAGLAAAQLLPFFDLLEHSQRSRDFATAKWAMPAWGLANLLVPLFHSHQTLQGPYVQGGQDFMSSYYPGMPVVVLAMAALFLVRNRLTVLLALATAASLLMAMGENGPLYPLVKDLLPAVGFARYQIKFVLLGTLTFPLLAAFALSRWEDDGWRSRASRTTLLAAAVAILTLAGWVVLLARTHPYARELWSPETRLKAAQLEWAAVWQNALVRAMFLTAVVAAVFVWPRLQRPRLRACTQTGLVLLLFLDVLTHTAQQNPAISPAAFAPRLWEAENHQPGPKFGEARVLISPGAEDRLLFLNDPNGQRGFLTRRLALWSNLNLLDAAPKVNGSSTLQLREQAQVQSLIYGKTNTVSPGLIDFLAVALVSRPDAPVVWVPRTNYCPLVTGGQAPVFASESETLAALSSPDFNPRESVYLSPEDRASLRATNRTKVDVLSADFRPHEIALEVRAVEPALLVIAQSWHHHWRAAVDGAATPLRRANHAFQCLEVPPGKHRVLVAYQDRRFLLGGCISGTALAACAGVAFFARRRAPSGG